MKRLSQNATDQGILDVVRQWVSALAEQRYDIAFSMTYHDERETWTPELIKVAVMQYGNPEPLESSEQFHVTAWESASAANFQPRHEVTWFEKEKAALKRIPPVLGYVWFDLPLDGQWSDLTATFDILQVGEELVLKLDEIHVM